jgi:hypothetical protein
LANPARIAFQARKDGKDRYVIGGVAGPPFASISDVWISSDRAHVWYEATDDIEHVRVVVDNRPDKIAYDGGFLAPGGSLTLSANGQRYAYVGFRNEKYFVIVDGREVASGDVPVPPPFVADGSALFSPDSAHVAVAVQRGSDIMSVVDGLESTKRRPVAYSPDSGWLVSWGLESASIRVLVNGVEVAQLSDPHGELNDAGVYGAVYFEAAKRLCVLTILGDELHRIHTEPNAPR